VLSSVLGAIHDWSEKRLLDYHEWYEKGMAATGAGAMVIPLSLALSTSKIIAESVPGRAAGHTTAGPDHRGHSHGDTPWTSGA
jgi:hypothetical protein